VCVRVRVGVGGVWMVRDRRCVCVGVGGVCVRDLV
jgi:hypothetical protein